MNRLKQESGASKSTVSTVPSKRSRYLKPPYWMLIPALFFLVLLVVTPFLISVYTSFTRLNQYSLSNWANAQFIGIGNYISAFTQGNVLGASTLRSVWVSIAFSLLCTCIITPLGTVAALAVNTPFRGQRWIRALFLIPYVLPVFVNGVTWRLLFMNGWGLVDRTLSALHLGSVNTFWLLGPKSFWAMVIADSWAAWPFIYLMVLAGLQGIPQDIYESAYIEGAGVVKTFFTVTLPMLRPIFGLALLLSTLNHFNNFTLPFMMFGTPPPPQADVLPLNVYVTSFQMLNFGLGAAMSLITLVVMMVPAFFYLRMLRLGERMG